MTSERIWGYSYQNIQLLMLMRWNFKSYGITNRFGNRMIIWTLQFDSTILQYIKQIGKRRQKKVAIENLLYEMTSKEIPYILFWTYV